MPPHERTPVDTGRMKSSVRGSYLVQSRNGSGDWRDGPILPASSRKQALLACFEQGSLEARQGAIFRVTAVSHFEEFEVTPPTAVQLETVDTIHDPR